MGSKWRENAQVAINGRGVVGVQLVAEVTEDGEGENIAAVGVVEGEMGGRARTPWCQVSGRAS